MDTKSLTSRFISGAYPTVKEASEEHANNLYITRKEVAASVCLTERERETVINSENVTYELNKTEDSYTISEKETKEPLAVKLVDEGKDAPVTKGPGGTATDITGEQIPAKSYIEGIELQELSWPATHFRDEVNTILQTTEPEIIGDEFKTYVQSNCGEIVAPYMEEDLRNIRGGVS